MTEKTLEDMFAESRDELKSSISEKVSETLDTMVNEAKDKKYGKKKVDEEEDEEEEDDDEVEERGKKPLKENDGEMIDRVEKENKEARIYYSDEEEEYTVMFYVDGEHQEHADFYTEDKEKAKETADQMVS